MKYSSRGRPILLGNSRTCAKAGPSTSAEASRATKKAMVVVREEGTLGKRRTRPASFPPSGLPAQEVGDQFQARRLALLGMELRAREVVATDDGGDRRAIVRHGQHRLRTARLELKGVHEIGVVALGNAVEQGVRLERTELVPSHVRDFQTVLAGIDAHDVTLDPVQAGMDAVLDAARGHELHADADAEEGFALLDHG